MKILIKTAFYDKGQEDAFKKGYSKHFDGLKKFVESEPNEFNYADFQAYFLFKRWRQNHPIWGNFNGIRTRVNDNWKVLDDFFTHDATASKFNSVFPDNNEQSGDSEGVGVAGGLTVLSSHHKLTEADWERIPTSQTKDFDYRIEVASTGSAFILLECKGTITSENDKKISTVSQHKAGIISKKEEQRPKAQNPERDIYYGLITVADPTNHLRSWLVDPPAPETEEDPRRYKLLARLYFYYYNLNALYQHSPFVVALINRIKVLEIATDYTEFDKLPLVKASGEEYSSTRVFLQNFNVEREDNAGPVFGKVVLLGDPDSTGQLLFFGFLRDVLRILIKQNIEDILRYDTTVSQNRSSRIAKQLELSPETGVKVKVQVGVNSPEAKFLTAVRPDSKPNGSYLNLSCIVDMGVSAAGRAFGIVRPDSIKLTK
jgi:hypothetical protein